MSGASLNRNLRIRLTSEEDQAIVQLAQSHGLDNRSRFIRKLIREAIGQGPDLLQPEMEAFREAVRQLSSVGRNINQIAHALNAGMPPQAVMDWSILLEVQRQLTEVQKMVVRVIARSRNRWVKNGESGR